MSSAGERQDEEGDDHEVEHGADDGAGVEHLVVPEHPWRRVGPLAGVDQGTGRVGDAPEQEQGEADPAQSPLELGQDRPPSAKQVRDRGETPKWSFRCA